MDRIPLKYVLHHTHASTHARPTLPRPNPTPPNLGILGLLLDVKEIIILEEIDALSTKRDWHKFGATYGHHFTQQLAAVCWLKNTTHVIKFYSLSVWADVHDKLF